MKLFKVFLAIAALFIALLAGALAYLQYADLNVQRGRINQFVSESLGRQFRIDGNIALDLWPVLRVEINKVSLANADWGSEPEMARLGHFSLQMDPMSLLRGPLNIFEVRLSDTDILVETSAGGVSNWALGPAQPSGQGSGAPSGPAGLWLEQLKVEQLRVRQRSDEGEHEFVLQMLNLETSEQGAVTLSGDGEAFDMPLVITGRANSPRRYGLSAALPIQLSIDLGETHLALGGQRLTPETGNSEEVTYHLEVSGLQALADQWQLPLANTDKADLRLVLREPGEELDAKLEGNLAGLSVTAQFSGEPGELALEGQVATLNQVGNILGVEGLPAETLQIAASLEIGDGSVLLRDLAASAGSTRLSARGNFTGEHSASTLELELQGEQASSWFDGLPEEHFQLTASLTLAPGELRASPLQLELGDSDVQGSARAMLAEPASLTLQLQSRRLDVPQLMGATPAQEPAKGTTSPQPAGATDTATKRQRRYVFSSEPLPLALLEDNQLQIDWSIDTLVLPLVAMEKVQAVAALDAGVFTSDATFVGALGGAGRTRLVLASASEGARFEMQGRLRDLRVNLASGEAAAASDIPPLNLTLDLTGTGSSAREMAAGSEGEILLTMGAGQLNGNLMERYSSDILTQLLNALNPYARTSPRTQLQCVLLNVGIESGTARINPMTLQSERLQVVAGGTIDLRKEKLNIEFNTKPRTGVGVSADMFVTPFVSLEGTLAKPRVGLNETGTLLNAGAAMATGGMSILWKGLFDRATGTLDICKSVRENYQHLPVSE